MNLSRIGSIPKHADLPVTQPALPVDGFVMCPVVPPGGAGPVGWLQAQEMYRLAYEAAED